MLEWYEAYSDYRAVADRFERLTAGLGLGPWRRESLVDAIKQRTGLDIRALTEREALAAAMRERDLPVPEADSWPQLVDELLSKHVEPTLSEPTMLFDYPIQLSPFAKRHRSEPGLVERFEAFVGGLEIANAFSELNDPVEQQDRMWALRDQFPGEFESSDPAFIQALEYGMPPTGGIGVGIDRLVMVLTGMHSIREVVLFPAMRD
jgi:lysyl-tRNA synthetase class 2